MVFQIIPKRQFRVPVYADCISPDNFEGKELNEILKLRVWEGNRNRSLGDLFDIKYEKSRGDDDLIIHLRGDLSKVRRIGAGMSKGKIIIDSDVGMHLGEKMRGGEIIVHGNAGSWAGGGMEGGRIEINGSAEDFLGAPYRGSTNGMRGGEIIVHGDAGREAGCYMRGGLIKIYGSVKHFVGVNMKNGTIFVQGDCAGKAGGGMLNGKIVICGHLSSILPTFTIDDIRPSVKINGEKIPGPFYRFIGDIADNGKGRLFVLKDRNPHLAFYEKYLQEE